MTHLIFILLSLCFGLCMMYIVCHGIDSMKRYHQEHEVKLKNKRK